MVRRLSRLSWRSIATVGVLLMVSIFLLDAAGAAAQDDQQARIDTWNATLERVDSAIRRVNVTDPELRELNDQVTDVMTKASAFAAKLAPQIAAADAQVKALSPVQGADETISDAVKADLATAQQTYGDLAGSQRQAIAIVAHGASTQAQINERRRSIFTARLLERRQSLLDPTLWIDAGAEVPVMASGIADIVSEWYSSFRAGADRWAAIVVVIVGASMLIGLFMGRRLIVDRIRSPHHTEPYSSRSKVVAAALTVGINTVIPAVIMFAGHSILTAFRLSPERMSQIWYGVAVSVVLFALCSGLARALLAPARPPLRLVSLDDALARQIFNFVIAISVLQALAIFIDRLTRTVMTALPLTVVFDGVLSVASALLIVKTVRTLNRHADATEEEDDGEQDESPLQRFALIVAGLTAAVAVVASLIGYVALSRFVTTQIAWMTTVFSLLYLLTMLTDELTTAWFRREGVVGSRLIASVGFAPRSLTQLGVVFNGVVRLILVGLALLAVFAPWGFDSNSVIGSFRQLFIGFTIGAITISPITILTAIAVFIIGLVATRAFQRWLDTRFLPTTRLDSGLRNSIRTIIGHIGWILAAVFAFGYAGLDLSSVAIVAGALSVGIGLGLQGIVNNFVSGLVLLAERPIRAGDWIVVGAEEGVVKRINIRATEIETFDRATVIVPNSSLITGPVKNMVLHDRSGRAVVKVGVSKDSDPAVVRDILRQIAKDHPLVLSFPEPWVQFTDFDAKALHFELGCYVSDNGKAGTVRSDLRFRCFEEFARHNIQLPAP
ncbi:small-conductance mechanosensitive channel [Kaistia hirudinis]|uniref:Small-conductance mechanosensitive channel n=1 Tax=Kaistia hirudinis TaxID=1293440 RepID=A0A840ATM8_9HYPH|nr:DUF3772 domain-containing protein [Kaistia hirudinis]MBB3931696.1 small-conductance mechanosensitive channel [Kaistia hirudinis]